MPTQYDDNLDLLDLEDDSSFDNLPEAAPFASPRPKKPWLLLGVGLLVIILGAYIIIRTVGSDSDSSYNVDLDTPIIAEVSEPAAIVAIAPPVAGPSVPVAVINVPAAPTVLEVKSAAPGLPVRDVADRKEVKFDPAKKPVAAIVKPVVKPAAKPVQSVGAYQVQFGSYSTRSSAETAQRKITASHPGLFTGKQFVILAAVLPNGTTTYRLRVSFASNADANGFCRNAKSDGLDCYVAKK